MEKKFEKKAILPHAEDKSFEKFQGKFLQSAKYLSDINNIFYKGKYRFFSEIKKIS